MYSEGDWIIEKDTGRVGIVCKKSWCEVSIRFGKAVALRYPEDIELAPLDIKQEDIADMIELSLWTKDKEWFNDLTARLGGCKIDKVREC
jgi:hypothetical protein